MFWKVPGFSSPSPVEQILDKQEFTLEELLDEDDIIQECKSLNGRLIAFLRERSTVEQLIRYIVDTEDSEDPKRTYKYPFTSCEVLCCELDAVYNALLEDEELMKNLFSLLDAQVPLNCKTAGYFGRVVGNLILRKNNEMLQYMQNQGNELLEKLVKHVDTTSIADVIKRLVGADDQNCLMPPAMAMAEWLADAPLVDLLLSRLAESYGSEAQANAADILTAIAHTQPSPLASKLRQNDSISALVNHALAPGGQILVPALDVCIALIEPRRISLGDMSNGAEPAMAEASQTAKNEAAISIVHHLTRIISLLNLTNSSKSQPTPYGLLLPPLGLHRLKVVELLAVLARSGCISAEESVISCSAIPECLKLFSDFPFNNLLHHHVASMLVACMSSCNEAMLQHLFEEAKILDWIIGLRILVTPLPRPGLEEAAAAKAQLRAGYLGHVTQVAQTLEGLAAMSVDSAIGEPGFSKILKYTEGHEGWAKYLEEYLHPQQDLENTSRWACGRPAAQTLGSLDSDGDDFAHEMDLEQITGMQPLYHRYSSDENEDDDGDDDQGGGDEFKVGSYDYGAEITDAITGLDIQGGMFLGASNSQDDAFKEEDSDERQEQASSSGQSKLDTGMDDDEVLLASSDDESPSEGNLSEGPLHSIFPLVGSLSPGLKSSSPKATQDSHSLEAEKNENQDGSESSPQKEGCSPSKLEGSDGKVIDKSQVWQGTTWQVDVTDEE